jgi:hypothetical protein
MMTEAKLAANRANAQKSTGPKTAEGRANSSRNSFKHGLYSKRLVTSREQAAALDALKADLRAEHQPANQTEEILVNELAEQFWRLRRARALEARLLDGDSFIIPHVDAAQRMMSSAERGFHKALSALRQLQKARGFVPQSNQNRDCKGAAPEPQQNPECERGVRLTPETCELAPPLTEPRPKEAVAPGFVSQNSTQPQSSAA